MISNFSRNRPWWRWIFTSAFRNCLCLLYRYGNTLLFLLLCAFDRNRRIIRTYVRIANHAVSANLRDLDQTNKFAIGNSMDCNGISAIRTECRDSVLDSSLCNLNITIRIIQICRVFRWSSTDYNIKKHNLFITIVRVNFYVSRLLVVDFYNGITYRFKELPKITYALTCLFLVNHNWTKLRVARLLIIHYIYNLKSHIYIFKTFTCSVQKEKTFFCS